MRLDYSLAHTMKPAVEVVGEGAGADLAEAVLFGEVLDFYYGFGHWVVFCAGGLCGFGGCFFGLGAEWLV